MVPAGWASREYRDLGPAVTGRRISGAARLTNRTLHHLASLDQTEEGPVWKLGNGQGLQFSAGMGGCTVSHQPFRSVNPAPY